MGQDLAFWRHPSAILQSGTARLLWQCALLLVVMVQSGCMVSREQAFRRVATIANFAGGENVQVRQLNRDSTFATLGRYFAERPVPSERTMQLLRRYSLHDRYKEEAEPVIRWLQELVKERATMEEIHALAEISELQASWLAERGKSEEATDYYAISIIHAYQFLFDKKLDIGRNAYDPQFRSICDIYNRALEGILRGVCSNGTFVPGRSVSFGKGNNTIEFQVEIEGRWSNQEFERFELVSDYQTDGLANQYHRYGLGVPLIAVRKEQAVHAPMEKYYPPDLTMPMTAFCHFTSFDQSKNVAVGEAKAILKLYDPLERSTVTADSQVVPLESDITTPLVYNLRDPILSSGILETATLLNAELAPDVFGMFMLEPYDPDKIPVVMVHGIWDSPLTWIQMFNDLRANREIHNNYQFWFYAYPTGQPFWLSARQMREDLGAVRIELDPRGDSQSLDEMILVGHSMGGLVSTLQVTDSANHFWDMVSDVSIDEFKGEHEALKLLRETFFFAPNKSIRRVITIATPFQGSVFANNATRWVGKKFFTLPQADADNLKVVARQNRDRLKSEFYLTTATSLDSLTPDAEVFKAMADAELSNATRFHNIVGSVPRPSLLSAVGRQPPAVGDGVVSLASARNSKALSERVVPEDHSKVHQHPACIYEVRRILLENLVELDRIRERNFPALPQRVVEKDSRDPNRRLLQKLRSDDAQDASAADSLNSDSPIIVDPASVESEPIQTIVPVGTPAKIGAKLQVLEAVEAVGDARSSQRRTVK